jgi:hypothetical protein
MTQLIRSLGNTSLILECGEQFHKAGHSMLNKLAELDHQGPSLNDGSRVQFGWTVLTLRSEMQYLRVCGPDYLGDALHALDCNLNLTLEVMTEQTGILRSKNVEGLDARFDDYVLAWSGALCATNLFIRRQGSERLDNTGWFIGDLDHLEDEHSEEDIKAWRVFEVLQQRRSLMKFLALPPGYTVVMRGDEVDSIMSGGD